MARKRRRLIVVLGLGLLAGLLFLFLRLETFTARGLERGLGAFFDREVRVGSVDWRLWPIEAEVRDLRVTGRKPGDPSFLEIPRAVVAPAFAPLSLGRIVLARLRLESPRIQIRAHPDAGDDIPRFGGEGGRGFDVRVRRLVIEDGELIVDHRRVPLELDLPNFRGRLAARGARALAGELAFGPGRIRFGTAPELQLGTEMDLRLDGPLLTVENAHMRAAGTDLAYEGQLRIAARPQGEFTLRGPVDLEMLDSHVMRSGFGLRGSAQWDGRAWVDGSRLRLGGTLRGRDASFDGVPVKQFDGQVGWDDKGIHIRDLRVDALGGSGVFKIEVPPTPSTARLEAELREADTEDSLRWIFGWGAMGLGSAATGKISLEWPRGRFRELSGQIALDLAASTDGRTPLWGRFEWHALRGVQTIDKAEAQTPHSSARLSGSVEIDNRADLALAAESRDVAAVDTLLVKLRRAFGAQDPRAAGFAGAGRFQGRWLGTLRDPIFDGRFEGDAMSFLGIRWGHVVWNGATTVNQVRSRSLEISRGDATLSLEGWTETGLPGDSDALDVKVRFSKWPSEDFTRALAWKLALSAPLSGEANVAGRRSAPVGQLRVASEGGHYYGFPFEALSVSARLQETFTEVKLGRARVGGGSIGFRGTLGDDGVYDGTVEATDVELADAVAARADWPLAGKTSGRVTLQGPLDRPRLRGDVSSPRLFWGDEGLGALQASLSGSGDGRVGVEALLRSPRVDLKLAGAVAIDGAAASELRVVLKDTSLDPFLRTLYPALPSTVRLVGSAEGSLLGPLGSPRTLEGELRVPVLQLDLPEYPVRNAGPIRLKLRAGALELAEVRLAAEGTDLEASGVADLSGAGPLRVDLRGAADLRVLSAVTRRLRGSGAARLAVAVRGTSAAPRVDGTLELVEGGLRHRGLPNGIEGLRGLVRFSERSAQLEGIAGNFGGGPLELEGQVSYALGRLASIDIRALGRAVSLRYPEGLKSLLDLDLRFYGDAERQWLAGGVDVKSAQWTKRYDLASELLAAATPPEEIGSLREAVRLDIKLSAPSTLAIDNNLATLKARAELNVAGSADAPIVLGRAEVDRGRIYFQGNTYTIRRGTIDFNNPVKIDPLFNIEAETRIRSYRVTLNVNGTLERVYPTLSSDPPLSAVQIVNLLAGADETAVASLSQSQTDQARLAYAGAATLAAGRLSEEMGLERQAERLFGLNRFSIDPALVRGDVTNPTARLTLGKRLTPDLNVLYSIDLKGGQERLLAVEYTLSDRFSVLLTSSEPGGRGLDVRIRQSR